MGLCLQPLVRGLQPGGLIQGFAKGFLTRIEHMPLRDDRLLTRDQSLLPPRGYDLTEAHGLLPLLKLLLTSGGDLQGWYLGKLTFDSRESLAR